MSTRYTRRGHIRTTALDGRPLCIIYIHDDPSRTQQTVFQEVDVLREFAAAVNRGNSDVNGKPPHPPAQPCDNILILSGNHSSTSDSNIHFSIGISTEADLRSSPMYKVDTYHVYCVNGDPSQGYAAWYKLPSSRRKKVTQSSVLNSLATALANDFRNTAQSRTPSPPSSGPVGFTSEGTPIYYSASSKVYYYEGSDGKRYKCDPPGSSQRGSPSRQTTASSSNTAESSTAHKAPEPVGYAADGTAYYYSRSKGMYWCIDPSTGQQKRFIVPTTSQVSDQPGPAAQPQPQPQPQPQAVGQLSNGQPYYWSSSLGMYYIVERDGTKRRYHP